MTDTYDYIIAGAGTAGCLLANRLSAQRDKRVLLIEAGGRDDYVWIHLPVGYLYCIGNPRTDWLYYTEPDPGLNGRQLRYPRGKVLGGSSSINGMIYMRGQARDYDRWGQFGNNGWSWDECLPYFLRHEDFYAGADAFHAAPGFDRKGGRPGGEWRVEKQRLRWEILDAFAEACVQAGIPRCNDFNRGNNEGVGDFDVNQRHGMRWNAVKAFLRPALDRPNLQIWTGAHISRVVMKPTPDGAPSQLQAVGVEVIPKGGGERIFVRATREVVLCAGAVGPRKFCSCLELVRPNCCKATELPSRMRAPASVKTCKTICKFDRSTPFAVCPLSTRCRARGGAAPRSGCSICTTAAARTSMAPSQLGVFTRSSPQYTHPNIEYHVQPLSLDAFGEPLHRFNAFTASVCNLNPASRGQVMVRSPDAEQPPRICPNYLSTQIDRRVAADSLRVTRTIVTQPALARYEPGELRPGMQFQSDEVLAKLAGDIGTTIFHPVGTAKMAPITDPMAVVDAQLRVHGIANLRVADASIMPTITSGNTNSPTLMIAERAAEWIIDTARADATPTAVRSESQVALAAA